MYIYIYIYIYIHIHIYTYIIYTVARRFNAVQYNMAYTFAATNTDLNSKFQPTIDTYILPTRVSYWVLIVGILGKLYGHWTVF